MSAKAKASPHVKAGEIPKDRALIPVATPLDEQRVEAGFWPKVRKVAGRVPFLPDALALWWCARDPETPTAAKGMMWAALAYFVLPTDVLPDVLAGIGFTDDAAVIAAVVSVAAKHLKPRHKAAAQAFINGEAEPAAPAR
ncbi:MAG TPA: YkvA family protein [Caulobacteraceae bacterium]|nr:YkvA family protein [Caulobacteraceae bacterium]